jgi:hypothetical protein
MSTVEMFISNLASGLGSVEHIEQFSQQVPVRQPPNVRPLPYVIPSIVAQNAEEKY